jgi:hypothetical protein
MQKLLKKVTILVAGLATCIIAATPMQTTKDTTNGNWLVINGQKKFLAGMNIAWLGSNSFGNDVGDNKVDINSFTDKVKKIRKAGGNCLRWWLHTDASNCPKIDATGAVTGLGSKTISNISEALDTAYEYGVVVDLCLFSFDLLDKGTATTANPNGKASYSGYNFDNNYKFLTVDGNVDTYIEKGLKPLLAGVGNHPAIMCWEVFNEPEGMINGHGWTTDKIDVSNVQRITNRIASAVHQNSLKMVSTGAHCADDIAYYKDAALKTAGGKNDGTLDFLQFHYYPQYFAQSKSPFHNQKSFWNSTWENKPILVGEFPAKDWSGQTTMKINDAFEYAFANGYAGAMSWTMVGSAKDSADFGNYATTAPALTALFNAHKSDIMIKDVTVQEMAGNYVMKVDFTNLPLSTKDPELGTNLTKDLTGKTNILFDVFVKPNSGKNIQFTPVLKVYVNETINWLWSAASDNVLNLSAVEQGKWTTISVPVSAFNAQSLSVQSILFQYKAVGNPYTGTVFFDNIRADNDTLFSFNAEGSVWATGADGAVVTLVKSSDVTSAHKKPINSIITLGHSSVTTQGKTISLQLNQASEVKLNIINLNGKTVASMDCGKLSAAIHRFSFDNMSSGHYFLEILQGKTKSVSDIILH